MNLVLLEPDDFIGDGLVRLGGRRLKHIREIHRAAAGDELRVGVVNGKIGLGRIQRIDQNILEMAVQLHEDPPPPLALQLVLALPRPKVLNRTIAAAVSMGVREIDLINAWRVEKAYWKSPRLSADNLRHQCILGLEQSGDTMLPAVRLHRLFTPFVRDELPTRMNGRLGLVAHPESEDAAPRQLQRPAVVAIGPEGGFIKEEIQSFREIGFTPVSLGARILRVETALAYLIGRLGA